MSYNFTITVYFSQNVSFNALKLVKLSIFSTQHQTMSSCLTDLLNLVCSILGARCFHLKLAETKAEANKESILELSGSQVRCSQDVR